MALTYLNRKSGKVVSMPEATEFTKKRHQLNARRAIEKLDVSKRWERLSDPGEIEAAQQAWDQSRQAKTSRRPTAPTPVYVVNANPDPEPEDDPEPDPDPAATTEPVNEVRHSGGPWFEVVVAGETVDKIQGRDAAEARLAELTRSDW